MCDDCHTALSADENVKTQAIKITERSDEIYARENPDLTPADVDMDAEMDGPLVCPACQVEFSDGNSIRVHFDTHHDATIVLPHESRKNKATSPLKVNDDDIRPGKLQKED